MNRPFPRLGLDILYFSGLHLLARPLLGGVGAILSFNRVRPPRPDAFQPNRRLEVTPGFLERVVRRLRRARVDLVSLDALHQRLSEGDFRRRFVCVTFDGGYRDTAEHAAPILRRYDVPFALFVPTSFPDRLGELWWVALERVVAENNRIALLMNGREQRFHCRTLREKHESFAAIRSRLWELLSDEEMRVVVRDLSGRYAVDLRAICAELCMSWNEIAELARDPLVTIGAQTVNHVALAKMSEEAVRSEMTMSRAVIESALGVRPQHFAYPFGGARAAGAREFRIAAELGFKTAVTTQPGVVSRRHPAHLMSLPRFVLDGDYQRLRFVKVLLSGAATGFR